jgi:hypothetical protein
VAKVCSLEPEAAKHYVDILEEKSMDFTIVELEFEFQDFGEWRWKLEQLLEGAGTTNFARTPPIRGELPKPEGRCSEEGPGGVLPAAKGQGLSPEPSDLIGLIPIVPLGFHSIPSRVPP